MATQTFNNLRIYKNLIVNENFSSADGFKIIPSSVNTRSDDVTGYVLKASSSDGKVVWAPGTTQTYSLSDLINTSIPVNVPDNSVLTFNSSTSNWTSTLKILNLSQLNDVDVSGITDGSILVYNSTASEFQVSTLPDSVQPGGQEGSIQFRNSSGILDGNNKILWDNALDEFIFDSNSKVKIGGLTITENEVTGLTNVPTSGTSAVNKNYVQNELANLASGLVWKEMVEYATTADDDYSSEMATLTSTGGVLVVDTIDTFIVGDRILFKNNSSDAVTHGIYTITVASHPNYTIERAADLSVGQNSSGAVMWVDSGAANEGYGFICNSPSGSDVIDTHQILFVEFNANTTDAISAGQGLVKVSNAMNLEFNSSIFNVITDNKLDLNNTGVSAGSFGNSLNTLSITVNNKGLITSASQVPLGVSSNSTDGILTSTDFNSFSDRLDATSLADGHLWIGSNGTGASQREITGDFTIGSDGSASLATIAPALPVVEFPNVFTNSVIKIPKLGVNTKGIVTSLSEIAIPTANASNIGLLSPGDWTSFNNKLTGALTTGQLFVGSGSGLAIAKTITGDAFVDDNGVFALSSTTVADTVGDSLHIPIITHDAKGRIISTNTEAIPISDANTTGLLSNADHVTFTNKMPNVLTSGKMFIGSVSNVATPQSLSGDVSITPLGVSTLKTVHETVPVIDFTSGFVIPRIAINNKGLVSSLVGQTIPTASITTKGVVSAADYIEFKGKLNKQNFVSDAKIPVGDGTNVNSVSVSGDVTLDNTGRITLLSTIPGDKTMPGNVDFTSASGDISTGYTDTNIKIGGSLGVAGKTYLNGNLNANAILASSLSVGATTLSNGRITNVDDPISETDAVNKKYVDDAALGIRWITPVSMASTVNITSLATLDPLSNGGKIDNVQLFENDRILIKNQTNKIQNGVYAIKTGAWERVSDMPDTENVSNFSTFVKNGDVNGASSYVVTGVDNIISTDEISFTLFSKSTNVSAGNGLSGITKLSVKTDNSTITLDPTSGVVRMKEIGSISGTYGSSLSIPTMATDKYGRVITISNTLIQNASYTDQTTKNSGIITGDQFNTFTNKIDKSLITDGTILIGTPSGPQAVTVSGDSTISNAGVSSLTAIHNPVPVATNTGISVPDIVIDTKGRVTNLSISTINFAGPAGAGILSSADYNTFEAKMDSSVLVDDGHILIGDGITRNSVVVSGDISLDNAGLATLSNTIVGNKIFDGVLTIDEIIVTETGGITAPTATVDDIIFTQTITSANGTITIGSTIVEDGRIRGLQPPVAGTDAVNRDYVDQASTGIKWQNPVATRAGENVQLVEVYHGTNNPEGPTLSTGLDSSAVGGYILTINERVLIDSQNVTKEHHGIYYVSSITGGSGNDIHLNRVSDFPDNINVSGFAVYVSGGTYTGLSYVVSNSPAIVNTDEINFSAFAGSSSFTAGVGTTKLINSLNVNYDDASIGIQNNALYVKNNAITSSKLADSSITTLKIADSSITSSKILNGSITNNKLSTGTITNVSISNVAGISPSKLSTSKWTLDSASDLILTGTTETGKIGLGETAKLLINSSKVVKTSGSQTIGGVKIFADNTKISSETELIRGTEISALTVSGGMLVKKNLESKNLYTENSYISNSAIINGVNINNNVITGVSEITSTTTTTTALNVGSATLTNNEFSNISLITGLTTPSNDNEAANKKYVDDSVDQFSIKRNSVKCTTTGELGHPPSGSYSITLTDNVTLVDGDRILVKDQGNTVENGLYVVDTLGIWARASDYPVGSKADGLTVYVENSKKFMICTNTNAIVDSAVLIFEPLITTGSGLSSNGNILSIGLENDSLEFSGTGKLKIGTVATTSLEDSSIVLSAGNGITLKNENDITTTSVVLGETLKVGLKLQTLSGLESTVDGLRILPVSNINLENSSVVLSTTLNKGIIFKNTSNNEISTMALGSTVVPEIKLDTNSGLAVSNDGLSVVLPDDFIQDSQIISLSGTKITPSTLPNTSLVNGITRFNVSTDSGLELSNDDGSTYEVNGTVDVDLGSELNLKVSDTLTRNDTSADITAQKSFTNTTDSTSKTSGAVTISGGLGVSKAIFANNINTTTAVIGNVSIVGGTITGITSTVNSGDAVSKNYVDNLTFGLRWTEPVKYATTVEIGIVTNDYTGVGAVLTIDGNSTWVVGDRILVQHETDTQNGIYEIISEDAGSVILARASDMPSSTGATGITVLTLEGTDNIGIGFTCIDEAPVDFVQFTSGDSTDAGDGLTKVGNVINAVAADATIVSDNTGIKVSSVPLDLLESSILNVVPGTGLATVFKEADDLTTRSDAVLGGYMYLDLDSNIVKSDVVNTFSDSTDSTNTSTGSVILAGGLGVSKTINAFNIVGSSISDGIGTLTSGALSGITTINASDDITLSKGTLQSITSNQDLAIDSTNGTVSVENVVFSNGVISSISGLAMSGNLTIGSVILNSSGLSGADSISVSTDPASNNELARKLYVDTKIDNESISRSVKNSVTFSTTDNIIDNIFSGTATTQGIDIGAKPLVVGQRILIKNQTNATFNGIYIVNSGSWTRATDFNPGKVGDLVTVIDGTVNKHKTFICTSIDYTFEKINVPGLGLTSTNGIDFDDVSLNLSGTNKLQIKAVSPTLITDRTVKFDYGDGIKSTGNPLLAQSAPFPILSVDYDDTSIGVDGSGKLKVKAIDISLLSSKKVNVQNSNSVAFINSVGDATTEVQLGGTLSAKIKLAPNSGLLSTINGIEIDSSLITGKLNNITNSQITSLNGSKLTGSVSTSLLSSDKINITAGDGVYVKNSLGTNISSAALGETIFLSTDKIDLNANQTFSKKITFSDNIESTTKSSGAIVISNGGLGVYGNITTGGQIESQTGFKSGSVVLANGILSGLSNPLSSSDAATKSYVDSIANGVKWTTPVRCATTGPIANFSDLVGVSGLTLNVNPHTYDGIVVALNDRVLVKNQADKIDNGIYYVSSYTAAGSIFTAKFTRVSDLPTGNYAAGAGVFVSEGTTNTKSAYICNNEYSTSIVDTHPMTWTQVAGSAVYSANKGITLNGSEFNVTSNTDQFEFVGKELSIKASGISSTEIADDSVLTSKIPDAAVVNTKLENSTYTITTGTGLTIKKGTDLSYTSSITPSLGETINLKVNSNVLLADGANQTLSGLITFTDTTASIDKTSGSMILAGGLGVQGSIHSSGLVSDSIDGTTITDGVATLSSGAFTGISTIDISDDITLSKGTQQNLVADQSLTITSTNGFVNIEGVEINNNNVSNIGTIDISDDITLSKGTQQNLIADQSLAISSMNGTVKIQDITVDGSDITGVNNIVLEEKLTIGESAGSKVAMSVQDGGGDTVIDFKLPSQHGPAGSMLSNNGSGNLSWVSNNVLYTRTVIDSGNYGGIITAYNINTTDDVIAVRYTDVNNAQNGPVNINLPLVSSVGKRKYSIVDEGGSCSINNIKIYPNGSNTLLGKTTPLVMSGNYNSFVIYNDGVSKWFVM